MWEHFLKKYKKTLTSTFPVISQIPYLFYNVKETLYSKFNKHKYLRAVMKIKTSNKQRIQEIYSFLLYECM